MNQDTHIIDWEKKKTVLHIVVFLSKPTSEHETGAKTVLQVCILNRREYAETVMSLTPMDKEYYAKIHAKSD